MAKYIARERGFVNGVGIEIGDVFEWAGKPPRWADPVKPPPPPKAEAVDPNPQLDGAPGSPRLRRT